jgi:hypothetical protein
MASAELNEDFIVYDTNAINLTRDEEGNKIITVIEDGSQFHFGAKLGSGSFSKVYSATRVWHTEDGEEKR